MEDVKRIRVMCPNLKCRSVLVVAEGQRGIKVRCPSCTTDFRVPNPRPPVPALPQPSLDVMA